MAYCLFGGIADKRKLLKDEADEPLSEILKRTAYEARDCESNHVQRHAAGSDFLWNPPSPASGARTGPAGRQWTDQLGKLISAHDRRVLS